MNIKLFGFIKSKKLQRFHNQSKKSLNLHNKLTTVSFNKKYVNVKIPSYKNCRYL
jgi:hypothetical protein